jgi:hypothetical protein
MNALFLLHKRIDLPILITVMFFFFNLNKYYKSYKHLKSGYFVLILADLMKEKSQIDRKNDKVEINYRKLTMFRSFYHNITVIFTKSMLCYRNITLSSASDCLVMVKLPK